MLLVITIVGLLLILLKEIGALPIDHVWLVIITVICLAITIAAGFAGGNWISWRRQ